MFCSDMIKIGKATNGYVVSVCVPCKPSGKGDTPMSSEMEAQYIAPDVKSCCAKIAELLPKLDDTYTSDKAFQDAFGAACMEDTEED
jgi:hypothetical protein